jgi:hypothetical protein
MERQDVMYVVAAIVIVALFALVIRPAMTGESVTLPAFGNPLTTQEPVTTVLTVVATPASTQVSTPPQTPVPTPTPTPSWDRTTKTVGFVDPATYKVNLNTSIPAGTVQKPAGPQNRTLVTYAEIKGQSSGTTEIVYIPFPYWELHYTVEPLVDIAREDVMVFPRINIQVMDADDPGRFVRVIDPDQLDTRTWAISDPRPWVEKFYEGHHSYYFIVNARFISSYEIAIEVPEHYT